MAVGLGVPARFIFSTQKLQETAMQIEGTVALVTGANRGIGKAFVQALLERGAAKVYAAVRDTSTIDDADRRVRPVQLDVIDTGRVAALAQELGDVQVVVNNAGIARPGTPLSAGLDTARAELDVNYFGLIAMTQAFAPVLAANGGGAFINILSVASWVGSPLLSTYAASKSAAWNFTNSARIELKRQDTHVVGVHVGYVDTDLTTGLDVDKTAPAAVAAAGLDAVEAEEPEALVDDVSRQVKAGLSDDQRTIYPQLEVEFAALFG
jgi:NAD(P)-dependent dehydrogenase (short-subunit alcohol dehydrogenase family)